MKKIMMKTSVAASLLLSGCSEIKQDLDVKDDNPAEQYVEEVIKDKTGIEVDFTPEEAKTQ